MPYCIFLPATEEKGEILLPNNKDDSTAKIGVVFLNVLLPLISLAVGGYFLCSHEISSPQAISGMGFIVIAGAYMVYNIVKHRPPQKKKGFSSYSLKEVVPKRALSQDRVVTPEPLLQKIEHVVPEDDGEGIPIRERCSTDQEVKASLSEDGMPMEEPPEVSLEVLLGFVDFDAESISSSLLERFSPEDVDISVIASMSCENAAALAVQIEQIENTQQWIDILVQAQEEKVDFLETWQKVFVGEDLQRVEIFYDALQKKKGSFLRTLEGEALLLFLQHHCSSGEASSYSAFLTIYCEEDGGEPSGTSLEKKISFFGKLNDYYFFSFLDIVCREELIDTEMAEALVSQWDRIEKEETVWSAFSGSPSEEDVPIKKGILQIFTASRDRLSLKEEHCHALLKMCFETEDNLSDDAAEAFARYETFVQGAVGKCSSWVEPAGWITEKVVHRRNAAIKKILLKAQNKQSFFEGLPFRLQRNAFGKELQQILKSS